MSKKSELPETDNLVQLKSAYVKPEEKNLDPKKVDVDTFERLPNPTGWRLLILPYRGKGKTEGGVLLPDAVIDRESVATDCGYVLKSGPLAYKDEEKFPSGPWCESGDWVVFRAYSGTRMKMYGKEFRLINDDTVEAVVEDPTGVVRA